MIGARTDACAVPANSGPDCSSEKTSMRKKNKNWRMSGSIRSSDSQKEAMPKMSSLKQPLCSSVEGLHHKKFRTNSRFMSAKTLTGVRGKSDEVLW
jgi:hypothetical protein